MRHVSIPLEEAVRQVSGSSENYLELLGRAGFDIGIYQPVDVDVQTDHARDEVYVVATGAGEFVCGDATRTFSHGDMFFVPAKVPHRFQNFTDDFSTWVIFFGAKPSRA